MQEIYQRFIEARAKMLENGPDTAAYQEANEEMWASILEALQEHRIHQSPLPPEMAFELESEMSSWVAGVPSERLPLLTKQGRRTSPITRHCKLHAVLYLIASPQITGDKTPRKTVRSHYKVAASTLQAWKNELSNDATQILTSTAQNLSSDLHKRRLLALMMASGRQYQSLIKRPKPKRKRRSLNR